VTTGAGESASRAPSAPPEAPKTHGGGTHGGPSEVGTTGAGDAGVSEIAGPPDHASVPPVEQAPARPSDAANGDARRSSPPRGPSPPARDASPLLSPVVVGPGDAARAIAKAIATRTTGVLAVESAEGTRRVVLREGDIVTSASQTEDESLLAFLSVRGELPRETVRRLAGKFPQFGRHAGAALVAHGYLRQDQLWPILRAHAEWVLGRALSTTRGTVSIEPEAAGRLRGEPGVFGGSTGAEVFVEVLRRIVSPDEALERLGAASQITEGEGRSILSECALKTAEVELVAQAEGRTVQQLVESAPDTDIATVLYAASLLGVIEIVPSIGRAEASSEAPEPAIVALDEEAIRERVRARMQLVDEADYFAVLGVPRTATGYEIRRAFLELRRAFEPARILTPQVLDLADDVRKIVLVLEEAYDVLRDSARRERYRRAIDAVPSV
jgi:Domain of unknown function (DUF4388)